MTNIRFHRGFSLIELMVGAVISIIASMIIFQVFATAERQKRTTTGAADSQTNGAIATYMIERDVKMAGWGLVESAIAGCSSVYSYYDDGKNEDKDGDGVDDTPPGPVNDLFASVAVTDGGASPDSLSIQYYDNPSEANFKFAVTTLRKTMPQSSSELNVNSVYGCAEKSLAIVRQGGNCTLMQITQVQGEALKLQHNPGGTASYNPPVSYQNTNEWPAYTGGATMQCFSQLFKRIYRINSRQLELIEPDSKGVIQTLQVAPEIVDLQAEYGVADAGSQQVNAWVPATGSWASPLSTTDTARIKAVRIALVARSAQADKPDTAGSCSTTTSTADWSSWASFSTVSTLTDWKCYRYKVFETVIPLRNIIWANL